MAHSYSKRREKKVHKMTRNGIVEQNTVTGEIQKISKRECELNLRMGQSTEQAIFAEKNFESRTKGRAPQNRQLQKKKQQRHNQQMSSWITEAPNKTNNTPDNKETISPSSVNITDMGGASQDYDFSTGDKEEKYISLLETSVADDSSANTKESLYFSSHTKQAKQFKSVATTNNTDKSKLVSEPEKVSNFEVEFLSNNECKANKRKTSLKFESFEQDLKIYAPSNTVQQEHQARQQEFNQDKAITENKNLIISAKPQPFSDTGKLQTKEKNLNDTPTPPLIQAKLHKMSRKRKKQMKAIVAKAEKKLKQETPELLSTLNVDAVQIEKSPINIDEKGSKLQKKTVKLKFDDTEKDKTAHILSHKIAPGFQPKQDNPDMVKSPLGDEKQTVKKSEKSNKLEFTTEEKQPKTNTKLERLSKKAECYNDKLKKAQDKLPSVKKKTKVRIFDETKGKPKTKLSFEKEILPQQPYKPSFKPIDLTKMGASKLLRLGTGELHQKVYEVEHENVGIQAGHHAERFAETTYHSGKRVIRSAFRYFHNRPYNTVKKLEKKALKANIKYSYQKLLAENPKLKSNLFSRFMQKRKIKQQYTQAARNVKRAGGVVKKTGIMAEGITKAVVAVVNKHPVAIVIILLLLLLVFLSHRFFLL